uniref:Uncharacterized protein n=2 Tax=Enterococcus TaxID=1350 RepID=A0A891XJM6_ENTHR|nr:hypothetical protein [Enterococcus faecium]QRN45615.1 hypothetical protein [Enterococcus hirae]UBL09617.1 hypothetical protein [Enterococcus hirae]UBL09622.1 hypothetical protein [Enterococcus hirae]UBL09970.1 hypothetical protein [Enterococcus casseliflavus]
MLFGKFCIDFGSTQQYKTEHCVEPNQIKCLFERQGYLNQKFVI